MYQDRNAATLQPGHDTEDPESWRPVMEIERTGIPHDFCIGHAELIADQVAEWVLEIISRDCAGS
jgi:hypothetical protein